MYAIVRTGGKQYRVEEGRSVVVDRLHAGEGEAVELRDVLLIAENGTITIGAPVIEGARVVTQVEAHGRAKKIIVFKYKSKVRSRKKTGHRQDFTRLAVQEILMPGQESKIPRPARPRRRKAEEAEEVETPSVEAIAEPVAAAPSVEEKPKRRLIRRPAAKAKAAPKPKAAAPKRGAARAETKKAKPADTADAKKKPARRSAPRKKSKE